MNPREPRLLFIAHEDCPPNVVYLLPYGSTTTNLDTGEVVELAPGYYVNPKHVGALLLEDEP